MADLPNIKICGITNLSDAKAAASLGTWALGFIFYKKSPRYVTPAKAAAIIRKLPKGIIPVGVFVDEKEKVIRAIIRACKLKAVQFHGSETPEFCARVKRIKTFKALRVKNLGDLKKALRYKTTFYLLDTFARDKAGGTGQTFDWRLLKKARLPSQKIILSGGLNPGNIREAVRTVKAYAYDASSGVERRPGKKCRRLLKKFFERINK